MSKAIAKHYVTDWKQSRFCSLAKVRQHKVDAGHGWQQFAETIGPSGHRAYSDVCPTVFPPDESYTKLKKGMAVRVRGVAA